MSLIDVVKNINIKNIELFCLADIRVSISTNTF
jgi:hypothetical protein